MGAVTLTKERKIYVAVLGLGCAALGADTLFFSDPAGASAAEAQAYAVDQSDASNEAPSQDVSVQEPETSVRHRLQQTGERMGLELGETGNAFAQPLAWPHKEVAPDKEQTPAPPGFADLHRLGAVMADGHGGGVATLHGPTLENGRTMLRVGETIDGYRLIELDGRSAVFEGPDGRIRLELIKDEDAGAMPQDPPPSE